MIVTLYIDNTFTYFLYICNFISNKIFYRFMKNIFLALLIFLFSSHCFSQSKVLTLEDAVLKQRTTLGPKKLNQLMFIPGTNKVSYLEAQNDTDALVAVSVDKGVKSRICSSYQINAAVVANGGDSIKTFPTIKWKNATNFTFAQKEKIWQYNITENKPTLIANIAVPAEAENNDAYDNEHIAFTIDNNVYFFNGKESKAITTDVNKAIVNGQTVHRSEFGINKGTFWSPKGSMLAYYRMDESMVAEYPVIDWSKKPAVANIIHYPMAGEISHEVTITIYDVATQSKVILKTGEPAEQYLTNIAWSPDEKYIYVAVLNRDQNHMLFNCYDVATGDFVKTLFEEANEKYVEPLHPMMFLKNNPDQFIWQSARNGWNHLYLYNTNGALIRQLTTGTFQVTNVLGLDAAGENIYFTATIESGITRHLCSAEIKTGKIKQLTTQSGTHNITMNESGEYFIDNFQSTTNPRTISVLNNKGVATTTLLQAPNPLKEYDLGDMKIFTIKASDGSDLYCRMFTPTGLDIANPGADKYPTIVYLYGGPHAQMVNNTWNGGGDLWFRYMAQKGYVVFTIDNRGSENRGMKFEQVTFRNLGAIEIEDQLTGVNYLKTQPFVDSTRMGLFGWSFGGFMTTSIMLKHPGMFKASVAGGPVIDWGLYEIMYTERYMDTPQTNPEGFKNNDLTKYVQNLKGKLMLIHGTNDDVVVWQNSLNFLKACVEKGKQVDYFVYPGHLHNVTGKDRAHLYQKVTDYFDLYLK